MGEGVEWALHSNLNLSWLPLGQAVAAAKLAEFYGLPAAYLNKQLQALARAGIVSSTSGPRGGFMLGRSPEQITLLDVVVAIEGPDEAFRCQQLLKRRPGADPAVDYRAGLPHLAGDAAGRPGVAPGAGRLTLADLMAEVEHHYPATPSLTVNRFTALRA